MARIVEPDGSSGSIAGGVAHLLDVVRCTVRASVPLLDAVRAASVTPADVIGADDVGRLVAGHRADLVVVDPASKQLLEGATLDYKDGLNQAGFSITNPNATRTCGCGSSFS